MLVVAGGQSAALFEVVKGSFDDVAAAVGDRVEVDGSAAGRAASVAVAVPDLVGRFGDHRGDPPAA